MLYQNDDAGGRYIVWAVRWSNLKWDHHNQKTFNPFGYGVPKGVLRLTIKRAKRIPFSQSGYSVGGNYEFIGRSKV
jgi:hypothetical protein